MIRSKDISLSPAQRQSRLRRAALQEAAQLRTRFSARPWESLTTREKDEVLRALAIHFGFVGVG